MGIDDCLGPRNDLRLKTERGLTLFIDLFLLVGCHRHSVERLFIDLVLLVRGHRYLQVKDWKVIYLLYTCTGQVSRKLSHVSWSKLNGTYST